MPIIHTVTPITAPAGALPGKTYGADERTGLLVMNAPTLQDVLACKGILVHSKTGFAFCLGQAFIDRYNLCRTAKGAEPTLAELAMATVGSVTWISSFRWGNANSGGSIQFGLIGKDYTSATDGIVSIFAVPHGFISGFGCSHLTGQSFPNDVPTRALNREIYRQANYGMNVADSQFGANISAGADFTGGGGVIYNGSYPCWFLTAMKLKMTVKDYVGHISQGVEDKYNAREMARTNALVALQTAGVNIEHAVTVPLYIVKMNDGTYRYATDFRSSASDLAISGGEAFSGTPSNPLFNPILGARHPVGAGYFTLPFVDDYFGRANGSAPYNLYSNLATEGIGDRVTLRAATKVVAEKISGQYTEAICYHQPIRAFYDVAGGMLAPKVLDSSLSTDILADNWALAAWTCEPDRSIPTVNPVIQSPAQDEAWKNGVVSGIASDMPRGALAGNTAAESWMLTPRIIARLVIDPVRIEGDMPSYDVALAASMLKTQRTLDGVTGL